jgi:UPF0042 nucleotide-binding protein
MDIVILTGMSGAGKSQAANFLEDMGYFCIDNLPPMLLPVLVRTFLNKRVGESFGTSKLAFVVDIRSNELLNGFDQALQEVNNLECTYRIIFLEASDSVLVSRFQQTRRRHPLSDGTGLSEAISKERKMLLGIRDSATHIIDTSTMAIPSLRDEIYHIIAGDSCSRGLSVLVESFGFKYGIPVDCDNMYDVRFLSNPFYEQELKMRSGKDPEIAEYLGRFPETTAFVEKQMEVLTYTLPLYIRECKSRLVIGIGCTGGRHRSVYIAEQMGKKLTDLGYHVTVYHRDIDKDPRYAAVKPAEAT